MACVRGSAVRRDVSYIVRTHEKGSRAGAEQEPPRLTLDACHHVEDGGETSPNRRRLRPQARRAALTLAYGQLAADPGSSAFKDRLYGFSRHRFRPKPIQISYSSDNGKTWSQPVTVNDDRSPEKVAMA